MQENKDKEMSKSVSGMNENITKETELIKKNQTEIWERKSLISGIKITTESFNRIGQVEERISDPQDKTKVKRKELKRMKKV